MTHNKIFQQQKYETSFGELILEGPLSGNSLRQFHFDEGLTAFRPAVKQFHAIQEIADLPEGRIIVARTNDTIIGYVTYLHPDPLERWSIFKMNDLLELGAIEITPAYRGEKVGSKLINMSMLDPNMENYIIISTEYYWHWDLDGTHLSVWNYRKVMEKMMASGGLHPQPTDDPEIISHPANCLMVRIGEQVKSDSIKRFDQLRFYTRYQFRQMKEEKTC